VIKSDPAEANNIGHGETRFPSRGNEEPIKFKQHWNCSLIGICKGSP